MSVEHFYWLDQIQPSHRDRVGNKAFHLAMLQQRGYPVLPGLVVGADLFQAFLGQIRWSDPTFTDLPHSSLHLDVDNPRQLQQVAQRIRQAIELTPLLEPWQLFLTEAVQTWQTDTLIFRPSLTLQLGLDPIVSYRTVGLLEARTGWAKPDSIALTLKQVWSELFRARSLLYWQRLGIQPQQIHLAVLVQPIRSAIAAGDVQMDNARLKIRSTWGLGQALVRGEVLPDQYDVDEYGKLQASRPGKKTIAYEVADRAAQTVKETATKDADAKDGCLKIKLLDFDQQTQLTLSDTQFHSLLHLVQQITAALKVPIELEWTFCHLPDQTEPAFYVTQAIPQLLTSSQHKRSESSDDRNQSFSPAPSWLKGIAAAPGKIVAVAWVLQQNTSLPLEIPPDSILVAPALLPEWILSLRQVAGIITEQGGVTSHGAILARESGIPAVVGVAQATHQIRTGDRILLDGDRGEVQRMTEMIQPNSEPAANEFQSTAESPNRIYATRSATQLMISLSRTDTLTEMAALPSDGVGLLRSELLMLEVLEQRPVDQWLQQDKQALIDRLTEQIQRFVFAFAPRPVFYRSLDVRSHEFPSLQGSDATERNPMMGLRGTFRYQVNPALFEVELAALRQVQEAGQKNLRLVLPFVRTVEEFQFCRQKVEQAGLIQPHFQLWIMAEVPSVLLLLEDYIQAGVQGIAIGTNDLTQFLFGVDRDHPQMASHFDSSHLAVQRAIQALVQTARTANLPCLLCGHIPHHFPEMIDSLIRQGITAISVEPGDLNWTSEAIDRAERRLLLEIARGRE